MDFLTEAKDGFLNALPLRYMRAFGWIAAWARARLWHAMALAFVLGLGLGALI
ncbi:MAG TPA: hypothetical protein VHX92_04795 [Rhizomicrobium sp.]|jgi:hypothetical protein|nr:hypothetical protein [Rhizomicrobium sp.]